MYWAQNNFNVWMGVFPLICFVIIATLALLFYFHITKRDHIENNTETPLDILKKRYALGEINKQEFDEKKKDLG